MRKQTSITNPRKSVIKPINYSKVADSVVPKEHPPTFFDKVSIAVTTESEPKLTAVRLAFERYWKKVELSQPFESKTLKQPIGWPGIVQCAKDRLPALPVDSTHQYAIALEAGIVEDIPEIGALNFQVCVIRDLATKTEYWGTSPGFTIPEDVLERAKANELASAYPKISMDVAKGNAGVIGPLTRQQYSRTDALYAAVLMALWRIVY